MIMKIEYIISSLLLCIAALFGCSDSDDNKTGNRPDAITNVTFTPNNGGGYFLYTVPDNPDLLYIRADYIIDTGEKISKTNSIYSDTLFIEGLGQVKEYEIKLYAIDRNENASEPFVMYISPLYANTELVLETIVVQPGFSSLIVNWDNALEQNVDICVNVKIDGKEVEKIYSSNLKKDQFMIENLEGKGHNISVYVKDKYGNVSVVKDYGSITPMIDGKIPKQKWSFLRNERLYGNKWDYSSSNNPAEQVPYPEFMETFRDDSLKNAAESFYEGRIEKFWDDIIDDLVRENLNVFHTGPQTFPFSYFIDMGQTIQASRITYWQRMKDMYENENVSQFQIWISDDNNPDDGINDWELVGTYTIVRPSDNLVAKNLAKSGHEFLLYPDKPRYTKPFRYLRYKATKSAGNRNNGVGSELTVFGIVK